MALDYIFNNLYIMKDIDRFLFHSSIGPSAFTDPMVRSSSRPQTGRLSPLSQAPTRISADANSVMVGWLCGILLSMCMCRR